MTHLDELVYARVKRRNSKNPVILCSRSLSTTGEL